MGVPDPWPPCPRQDLLCQGVLRTIVLSAEEQEPSFHAMKAATLTTLVLAAAAVLAEDANGGGSGGASTSSSSSALPVDRLDGHALAEYYPHLRLGKSGRGSGLTSSRFPQDLLAKPGFRVHYDEETPVRNATAVQLLERDSIRRRRRKEQEGLTFQEQQATPGATVESGGSYYLLRGAPNLVHLCHVPEVEPELNALAAANGASSAHAISASRSTAYYLDRLLSSSGSSDTQAGPPASLKSLQIGKRHRPSASEGHKLQALLDHERHRIVARGLRLLQPLKHYCLMTQIDFFTYSFCHGKYVRQFKALNPQAAAVVQAAQQARELEEQQRRQARGEAAAAAGSESGATPAIPQEEKSVILQRRLPTGEVRYEVAQADALHQEDPRSVKAMVPLGEPPAEAKYAFKLGRWNKGLEQVAGTGMHYKDVLAGGGYPSAGSHSSEESVYDEESTFPVVQAVKQTLGKSSDDEADPLVHDIAQERLGAEAGTELMEVVRFGEKSEEQRYLMQLWTDGTRCDVNNEPRIVEVQVSAKKCRASR